MKLELPPNPWPTHVECQRVKLVPLMDEHLAQRTQWTADDELARLMGVDVEAEPVESQEAEFENNRQWLATRLMNGARVYAITVDGRYIGDVDLAVMPMEFMAQFTIFIGDRASWGQGYGSETVGRLLEMLFTWTPPTRAEREAAGLDPLIDEPPLVRPETVVVDVPAGNERALGFWKKLGFEEYNTDEAGTSYLRVEREAWLARRA
jgi:RimJ/RimL family protein N-acetyltransferase